MNRKAMYYLSQLAHDIRSPLLALEVLEANMNPLPEETRVLTRDVISRIQEIARQILARAHDQDFLQQKTVFGEAQSLSTILKSIVSEKRALYQHRSDLEICLDETFSSDVSFVQIAANELRRVISNLIDNSAEAIEGPGGIIVKVAETNSQVQIKVQDTGKGISPEVLSRLGQRGASFGKKNGMGLGLYFARNLLQDWGGSLQIESPSRGGATVTLSFPRTPLGEAEAV